MPRLPLKSDFPSDATVTILPPYPAGSTLSAMLVFIHGLGDNQFPYIRLAEALKLPETGYLVIQGPTELPMTAGDKSVPDDRRGYHWGDDLIYSSGIGSFELDIGYERALSLLDRVLVGTLVRKCGFHRGDIILWGFEQGGSVALQAAAMIEREAPAAAVGARELGGVITIGGPWYQPGSTDEKYGPDAGSRGRVTALPEGDGDNPDKPEERERLRTAVLVCHGKTKSGISEEARATLQAACEHVQTVQFDEEGDKMPTNKEQMLPVMKFFAKRLRSRRGVPKGAVEVGREVSVSQ